MGHPPGDSIMPRVILNRAELILTLIRLHLADRTLERLHHAIEAEIASGIQSLLEAADSEAEGTDALIDDESEKVEELLGLAFIAAQSFIARIRILMLKLNNVCIEDFGAPLTFIPNRNASDILGSGKRLIDCPDVSAVEAVHAVGNFWKHSDEWSTCEVKKGKRLETGWDLKPNSREQLTAKTVAALGIVRGSSGNMRRAASALGVLEYGDLRPIRLILHDWANELYRRAKGEIEILRASAQGRSRRVAHSSRRTD